MNGIAHPGALALHPVVEHLMSMKSNGGRRETTRSPLDSLEWPVPASATGASYASLRDPVGSELLSWCSVWVNGSCLTRILAVG
jgi:hypothetical protein